MCKKMFVLMCVVVMVASSATLAVINDPAGHWELNEGSGTAVADSSGNGNAGTIGAGNTNWIGGSDWPSSTGALEFLDSENVGHITVADDAAITPTAAITVSAWVKIISGASQWAWNTFAEKQTADDPMTGSVDESAGWRLQYIDDAYPMMYAQLYCEDGSAGVWFGGDSINDGQWHHVAFTYATNEVGGDERIRAYTDGVHTGTENSYDGALKASASDLSIGNGRKQTGGIDDFRIYSRALSDTEIAALAVPEPATMLILGLGGLLISRRRRA